MPPLNTWSTVPSKAKLEYSSPPTKMPRNSELYTSLVISARAMAMTGGSRDQKLLKKRLGDSTYPLPPQLSQVAAVPSSVSVTPIVPQSGHSIIFVPVSSVGSAAKAVTVMALHSTRTSASNGRIRRLSCLIRSLS